MKNPSIGQKVQFNASFISEMGHDKEIADLKGEIVSIKKLSPSATYCRVKWNDGTEKGCLASKLSVIGSLASVDKEIAIFENRG